MQSVRTPVSIISLTDGEAFARLIPKDGLVAYRYEGFFRPTDTIKDRRELKPLHESGTAPWVTPRLVEIAMSSSA